jgi:hypothetical protein
MGAPIRYRQGYLVMQLKEQKPATREDFDKNKDTQVAQLLRAKQAEALSLYVKRLREANKADVKIENPLVDVGKDGGAAEPSEDEEGY